MASWTTKRPDESISEEKSWDSFSEDRFESLLAIIHLADIHGTKDLDKIPEQVSSRERGIPYHHAQNLHVLLRADQDLKQIFGGKNAFVKFNGTSVRD